MTEKDKKNTAEDFAESEIITPQQLLQEIEPLLEEYFIGDFEIKNNSINMGFKNGQNFHLAICELN